MLWSVVEGEHGGSQVTVSWEVHDHWLIRKKNMIWMRHTILYRNAHVQVMPRAIVLAEVTMTNDIPKHYFRLD